MPSRTLRRTGAKSSDRTAGDAQRAAGNQAEQRIAQTANFRAQAKVNTKRGADSRGDSHEQEADRFAEDVVSSSATLNKPAQNFNNDAEPKLKDLPLGQQERLEARLGTSLKDVRMHAGPAAETAAAAHGSRAFTQGSEVFFGRDELRPDTTRGQLLIAHELAHVQQQQRSGRKRLQRKPLESTCSADDPAVCEPIPENPLADYPFLAVALDRESLQLLQDAAYRREHLRRGVPYDGEKGLFFAQAPLSKFLAPTTEYVSREELIAALMPGMLNAARSHTDVEVYVAEIARNEAARQMLEPLGDPLLNVELPDPDGQMDIESELTFTVNFKRLQDDHGALALASLDPLSMRGAYLWTLIALNDARQLSEIALLNAQVEWLLEKYGERLNAIAADPADYTQDEIYALAHEVMPKFAKSADTLASVLMPGNKDQAGLIAKVSSDAHSLASRADTVMQAMNDFRSSNMPDQTAGEAWEENADDIRKAASEDWDEGGLSYFAWAGNKLGLGANKLMHGTSNLASGFGMDMRAARAHAYRLGHISYNDLNDFHPSDILKGAIMDFAVAMPFFGEFGAAASGALGLESGTVAAAYTEGTFAGVSSGIAGAAATDATSFLAAQLSLSESERRFQAAQIGGPASWLEAGAWGGIMGGPSSALIKLMPRPRAVPKATTVEPEAAAPNEAPTEPLVSTGEAEVSTIAPEPVAPAPSSYGPAKGIKGWLQRSLLNQLISRTLEGSEPVHLMPQSSGPIGEQLLSVSEGRGPMVSSAVDVPFAGPVDLSLAPDAPMQAAAPVEANFGNPFDVQIEVTEAAPATQFGVADMGGVTPQPGTRATPRAQWQAQNREQRIERRIDAIFAQLEQSAGQPVAQEALPAPMAIDLQTAIRQALANLQASGRRSSTMAGLGTMLHAELARVLRTTGFPAGAMPHVELTLSAFNMLSPTVLQRTVDQWFQNEGQAYGWLRSSIPRSVLDSLVGDIKPDFEISVGGNNIAFDLTSRERGAHLAKTMLYAAILAREGQMTRVQEYYWVRWNWRGQ
ncbi:MAG: hypothetical protein JWN94_4327 [Betaproteobacteria bacterium]|nr:hypothetical protein [Betaproteobacteria bacterium]